MNKFIKYCPNVWVAECEEEYEKGDLIFLETKANQITLAMPESLDYFKFKLEEAEQHHKDLKDNPEKRQHSYDLTYCKKAVNELKKKVEIAMKLWGDIENE